MMERTYPRLGERIYEAQLPNGLTIMVIPKEGFAKTHAFLAVNYGSMDTVYSLDGRSYTTPRGVAHYLEHKMFDMPYGNAMQKFSEFGGNPNAFTSYDMTAYYVECTDHVKENLKILLEYVSTPFFTAESVQKEQGIIAQEIRMYEDSADACVFENLFSAIFSHHPIRYPIAGTVESIAEITEETLNRCYSAFYTPSNMILCVVGDVEPQMVIDLAAEGIPAGHANPIRDYGTAETMRPQSKRSEKHMEVSIPTFALGFKTEPADFGIDSMRQEIIGDLAAEMIMGEASPLYARLYADNLIDSGFSAGYEGLKGAALLSASGDSIDPDGVMAAILGEADRFSKDGMDDALFLRLKRSALGRRIRNLDSFSGICYRVCACRFEGTDAFAFPECFHEIDQQQVSDFLTRTVTEDRCAISVIYPHQKGGK